MFSSRPSVQGESSPMSHFRLKKLYQWWPVLGYDVCLIEGCKDTPTNRKCMNTFYGNLRFCNGQWCISTTTALLNASLTSESPVWERRSKKNPQHTQRRTTSGAWAPRTKKCHTPSGQLKPLSGRRSGTVSTDGVSFVHNAITAFLPAPFLLLPPPQRTPGMNSSSLSKHRHGKSSPDGVSGIGSFQYRHML